MKHDREYILLLDFFARLVESTKGTALYADTAWLDDTQPLAAKFVLHAGSIFYLSRGTKFPKLLGRETEYLDHHSIIVLVRAAHELYLAFNFIYVAPKTLEEKAFRHKVWELGAFLDRQKFPATQEENIKKLQSEKSVVDSLKEQVLSSKLFSSLNPDQQRSAVTGEWRLGNSWAHLAEAANLDKVQFSSDYRYLCSYAHTGHLSIFQMLQAADISDTNVLTEVWIDSVIGLTAHFIYDYMKVYPKTRDLFKQYPEAEQFAFIYDGLGRKPSDSKGGG